MTHEIPHQLELDQAKLVAKKAVEAYSKRFQDYSFQSQWHGDDHVGLSFEVAGKRLEGELKVLPAKLALQLDVPFVFKIFQGKAIEIIEREAKKWIGKAEAGELEA